MGQFAEGQSPLRKEDHRLINGRGRFTDDCGEPGDLHAVFVRSPHAHAIIKSIDVSAAQAAPGVVLVLTGKDVADAFGLIPCIAPIPGNDGPLRAPPRRVMTIDRVRHVGDPVAVVIAETINQARDAADLVEVDYDMLPAIADTEAALAPDAPQIWDIAPHNLAVTWEFGDKAKCDAAFAAAARVVSVKLINNRLVVASMEPRNARAVYDEAADRLTLHVPTQGVHIHRMLAAGVFQVPPDKLRVLTTDVGGSFGMKSFIYPEPPMVGYAAKLLKRPVRWQADRSESFLTDNQGRDHVTTGELALDAQGKFIGFRMKNIAAMGAYLSAFAPGVPTVAAAGLQVGCYTIPVMHIETKCVFTNTTPTDAYRGAGRPEAAYIIERLVDVAAHELGVSPIDLRRRNLIPKDQIPYASAGGITYDSGDFIGVMDRALDVADVKGFPARRALSAKAGKRRGLGLCYYVEKAAGIGNETAGVTVTGAGRVRVVVGNHTSGQGQETVFAQLTAARLGVSYDQVDVLQGDTDWLPSGGLSAGSGSLMVTGPAIHSASEKVLDDARQVAADALEAAPADIDYADGQFRIKGTDRVMGLFEVAARAPEAAISAQSVYQLGPPSYPNGCHVCEIEIDPDTGVTQVVRHTVVDDFGLVINPMIVEGQVHGGCAQGLGQAMGEHVVYDAEGQLITGSFMDYWMPRADNMPAFKVDTHNSLSTTNPMGVKGCGEAGATGAPPAFVNAVVDALSDLGIVHVDMPVTPLKLWNLIRDAQSARAA
jgi:carbon-monoxide dehydrogenase large subunit